MEQLIDWKIISPSDIEERDECSFCHIEFESNDERINTCTHEEYITLCRKCYSEAGNSVR